MTIFHAWLRLATEMKRQELHKEVTLVNEPSDDCLLKESKELRAPLHLLVLSLYYVDG